MDVDRLMKNDELSSRRPCTKENDQQNCLCAQCLYQNGIVNQKAILNDEKSLTSSPNSLNSLNQEQQFQFNNNTNTNNSSTNSAISSNGTKKLQLNPIASIKNFINSTGQQPNKHHQDLQTKHNSINNSLNSSISNCLNHSNHNLKESALVKHADKLQDDSLHDDDHLNLILNSSNDDWYVHCHQKGLKDAYSDKNESANRRLLITTILCFFFLITELVGGYISNSLSIMTDAAHLLSDIVSFGLSLFAVYLSKKRATKRFTFGYQRAEILGAICSILLIWLLTAVVVYFAVVRIITMDFEIESTVMMIVALFGIAVNILMGITLHGCMCPGFGYCSGESGEHEDDNHFENGRPNDGRELRKQNGKCNDKHSIELEVVSTDTSENGINLNKIDAQKKLANMKKKTKDSHHSHRHGHSHGHSHDHDQESINVRAAIIHVLGDLIQSIGVFVAAVVIHFKPEWKIADPICTFLFSIIVMFTTVKIMKESILIIMESSPDNVDYAAVKLSLLNINGVQMVHNLYIWQLTVDNVVLAGHLVVSSNCNIEQILQKARILLKEQHNITHITIQCERYQPRIMLACDSCNEL